MTSIFKKLLFSTLAILSFSLVNAQTPTRLQIIINEPDFSDGYGFTKNFYYSVNNLNFDDVTIPADVFLLNFTLPTNVVIDYASFVVPEGFEFLADEESEFTLINTDPISIEALGLIEMNIPITPLSVIPSDGSVADYLVSIDIEDNPSVALDRSNMGNIEIVSGMSVPDMESPLPVNFLSFVASGNDCKVNLEWKTSNETRTGSFAVERSHNGTDYTMLTEVKAIEAATATLDYAYTDAQPLNGTSFYRIRQMDLEGKATYSQARMIYGDCDNANVRMYPNPAADYILVDGIEAGSQIVVYNVLGQVIISKSASASNERINLSEIAAGSYTLNVVKGNNIVFSGKLLKK